MISRILLFMSLITLLSCGTGSDNTHSKQYEKDISISQAQRYFSEQELGEDKGDTHDNHPYISAFLGNRSFREVLVNVNLQSIKKTFDLDSLLSMYTQSSSIKEKISILRQSLIATHFKHARTIDSLQYLDDGDLFKMIAMIFHVDIEADPQDIPTEVFVHITKSLDSLLEEQSPHATIITFITNEVFRYMWMRYEFKKIDDRLVKCAYNAGGMAGSAHTDLFRKSGKSFAQVDLKPLLGKLRNIMTNIAKEKAYVDIDRFEMKITKKSGAPFYSIEAMVQVYSGASCCPPYVIQFHTMDFKSFERGSLHYSMTEHLSDPNKQPNWIFIQ
ncbi:MAG: hypothetical protein RLZZ578_1730 [Bacteroidota bacterium]